ncbi:MAG: aspartate aminotransferase family protein, partial [Bacteroidetes bacterium]|nr:aspartate aminotransferase family protein [Bacteroidota bacterium]
SVSNVGHNNKKVVDAVCAQAHEYLHLMVYGEFVQSPQVKYAQKLNEILPEGLDSIYFVNSGSEAVEAALKLAKRHTKRTQLISFRNAYHGSSHGALSMMGNEYFKNSFRPLLPDVYNIEFDNVEDLQFISEKTAAVIIEPIQGEGGFRIPTNDFLKKLRSRCDEVGAILIFDEIQTGFGRTGKMFASQKYGVTPDILIMAKAMGGGMPLGGLASSRSLMNDFKTNPVLGHITTFGGHPVCCAAGLAAVEFLQENHLVEKIDEKSDIFYKLLKDNKNIIEIRRVGLLLAVEFGTKELCDAVCKKAFTEGLLTESFLFCESAMRIAPPLIVTNEQIVDICQKINKVINAVCDK